MNAPFTLDQDTEKRLNALANATGQPAESVLRDLIRHGLEDAEDYLRGATALKGIQDGSDKALTPEDFWRGLDD
jgi:predicted DNA-binding protein